MNELKTDKEPRSSDCFQRVRPSNLYFLTGMVRDNHG